MQDLVNSIFLLILLLLIVTHYEGVKSFSQTFTNTTIKLITFLQGK